MSSSRAYCFFIFFLFYFIIYFLSAVRVGKCTPPTCYSRALQLSKEIMDVLEKTHRSPRTNSCVTLKLHDFIYALENLPTEHCRTRPRIVLLICKIRMLYEIIRRACYQDIVFRTSDCEALDTGISQPQYMEETLQLLEDTI